MLSILILAALWSLTIYFGWLLVTETHKLVCLHYEAKAYRNILNAKEAK